MCVRIRIGIIPVCVLLFATVCSAEQSDRRWELLHELIDEGDSMSAKILADCWGYESKGFDAHLALENGSIEGLLYAFYESCDVKYFSEAGCTLNEVFRLSKPIRDSNQDIVGLVSMGKSSWTSADRRRAKARAIRLLDTSEPHGIGAAISSVVISFYRMAVAPAIGSRCDLLPSCSRYYGEASRRHGLLGIPMVADRFIREPVESASDKIVRLPNGERRHADPVSAHDFWFYKGLNK